MLIRLLLLMTLVGCGADRGVDHGTSAAAEPPEPSAGIELPADVHAAIRAAVDRVRAEAGSGAAWRELGELYEANGLPALALECYARAAELAPEDARAWYHLARALGTSGDAEGALEAAGHAAELAPEYGPIHWRCGGWWLDLGRLDAARAAYTRAVELDSRDPAGRWGLARVALELGDPGAALSVLAPLEGLRPDFAYTHHLRASALRRRGATEEAAAEAARGGEPQWIDPWKADVEDRRGGFHGRLARVRAAVQAKDLEAAARQLEEMHAAEPDNVNVLGMLSDVYGSAGRTREAEALLIAARERNPLHYRVAINLALVYERIGDRDRALEQLDACLRLHPSFGLAHYRRGRLLSERDDYEAALAALKEAQRVGERGPQLSSLLGRCYAHLSRWPEAAAAFDEAFAQHPVAAIARLSAEAHARAGEREPAWEAFAAAQRLDPGEGRLVALRALLVATVGEPPEAPR